MLALEHLCSYVTTSLVLLMILHTAFHAVLLEVKVNKCLILLLVMLVFCLFNALSNNVLMNNSLAKYHLYGAVGACVFWIVWSQSYNMLVIQLNRFLIKPIIYRISKVFIVLILIVQLVMTGVYVKANLGDKDPNGEDAVLWTLCKYIDILYLVIACLLEYFISISIFIELRTFIKSIEELDMVKKKIKILLGVIVFFMLVDIITLYLEISDHSNIGYATKQFFFSLKAVNEYFCISKLREILIATCMIQG